jgi:hypothetical protein
MLQNSFEKISDGKYAQRTVGAAGSGGAALVQTSPNDAANSTSVTDTATVTAPAAGAAIATTPALSVGTWDIECITYIGGTTVASLEATNMRLLVGAAAIGRIMNPVPGTTGGVGTGQLRVRYKVTSGTPVASIIAVAAGTAGSVYSASIVAKRVV